MEKINIQQAIFFSFLNKPDLDLEIKKNHKH